MSVFKNSLLQYVYIVFGCAFLSYGAVTFLSPNSIITGGGVGIALLIHSLFPSFSLGTFIALVSTPFVLLGYLYFGKAYTFKTLIAITLIASFTDIFKELLHLQPLTDDVLLAAVFGGIFIGIGVGLIIRGRSSTGSTSVVGEIVALRTKYRASEVLLFIDALIMLSSMLVFDDMNQSLYSMFSVYVTSRTIDMIISGRPSKKTVSIVTENIETLAAPIREKIQEHGTIVVGEGLHRHHRRNIIFVAVEAGRIPLLKELVQEYDPDAFMIISEASQFHGRGHHW